MGYERLAGRSLDRPTIDALWNTDQPTFLTLARRLGEFLAAIHSTPVDDLSEDVHVADRPEDWLALLEAFRSELYGFMRPDAIAAVEREFAAFLGGRDSAGWQPCLRHGDFGGANLLYDDDAHELTGVIDFGSAAIGDPAVDLAGISAFDARLAQAMHATYPALFTPATQRRASFYRSTFALQQALWALRADDADEFNDGIASYR
jgi:aminoglycoside 2''-phosphotransferase